MALNKRMADSVREKIKTTQLIEHLQAFALDEECQGRKLDLSALQVKAALALINKNLPDLRSVDFTGHVQQTIEHRADSAVDSQISKLLGEDADSQATTAH